MYTAVTPWFSTWALILLLIILLIVAIAGFVLVRLLRPTRQALVNIPEQFLLPYENVRFTSSDQTMLNGWWIPSASGAQNAVIFAHGYGDNRSSLPAVLPLAKQLHEEGFASLLFDFRHAGESSGHWTTIGIQEQQDLAAAIDFVRHQGYRQIALIGFSMGASTVLQTAASQSNIAAIIVDSPFADLQSYLRHHLPKWTWLPAVFTPFILRLASWTGLDLKAVQPIHQMHRLRHIPIFFIHTKQDPMIPYQESIRLLQAYSPNYTQFWWTDGQQHVDSFRTHPQAYLQRVTSFLKEQMPG